MLWYGWHSNSQPGASAGRVVLCKNNKWQQYFEFKTNKNKTMRKLINLVVMAIIMIACTKKEEKQPHTVVEGYVIHSGTKQPLDSVRVSIWDGIGTNTQNNYDTTYTNAQGFFHIEVDGNEPVMFLYKKNYSFEYSLDGAALGIIPLTVGLHKDMKFEMDAWAYFKPSTLYCKDCEPNDTTWYGPGSIVNPPIHSAADGFYLGKGPNLIDYTKGDKGWPSKGDRYNYYWFYYQLKGIWHEKVDSVFIKSFATYTDTLYY
jgi:hypothetical protein